MSSAIYRYMNIYFQVYNMHNNFVAVLQVTGHKDTDKHEVLLYEPRPPPLVAVVCILCLGSYYFGYVIGNYELMTSLYCI